LAVTEESSQHPRRLDDSGRRSSATFLGSVSLSWPAPGPKL
jgi:hypothetical protein